MNEEAARKLARYRVGEDQHMGKSMTAMRLNYGVVMYETC